MLSSNYVLLILKPKIKMKPTKEKLEDVFVSKSCKGEICSVCGKDATNKLGEEIPSDDPDKMRHPLTAYVCGEHFRMIVGNFL